MTEPNIIQKDWQKIKKFFTSMKNGLISLMIFMLRWIIGIMLAGTMVRNTGEQSGWVIAIIIAELYIICFLFHKTYDLEKWLIEQK